jgi:hypothetical protein
VIDQAELRRRLKPILEAEDRGEWDQVDKLSDELNRELTGQNFENSPEIVNHYLDDADIREKDERYGETQRRQVRRFVETGEFKDSTPIPLWSCGLVAALIIAALIWMLK